MKKILFTILLIVLLIGPFQAFALTPGYGIDLNCITTNYSDSNCNNKEDVYKRVADLERRVNELETKNCVVVEGSIKLSTLERMDSMERKINDLEFMVKTIQDNIMSGLRNILTLLILKK